MVCCPHKGLTCAVVSLGDVSTVWAHLTSRTPWGPACGQTLRSQPWYWEDSAQSPVALGQGTHSHFLLIHCQEFLRKVTKLGQHVPLQIAVPKPKRVLPKVRIPCTSPSLSQTYSAILKFRTLLSCRRPHQVVPISVVQISSEEGGIVLEKVVDEDRKSTRLNSSHLMRSRMPSSA